MAYIEIAGVGKVFKTQEGKTFEALRDVNLQIQEGEFVSIIGHSGCGKSTLLNMVGGFYDCDAGEIRVAGKPVAGPGPDRMFVFQNHSLLPWLTVRDNIRLAVDAVFKKTMSATEKDALVEEHVQMVSLGHAAEKLPGEISGGMKQRVGIARALATKPKVLLLDEPFGALDALTRGRLQEQVLEIWEAHRITVLMVTHDVEEALLLSDRIVMMANGPAARVGEILTVELPRPRTRTEAINNPNYYRQRNELLYFLNKNKKAKAAATDRPKAPAAAVPNPAGLEKPGVTLGFIPLSDCAPLVVAKTKGFFEKHGLTATLSREPSWKAIQDGTADGRLDLSMMVTGMPLGKTLGAYKSHPLPMVASMTLSRNGNAITLARKFYDAGVRDGASLKNYLAARRGDGQRKPIFGMVFPSSMHNLLLRQWLSAHGIRPDEDVEIIAVPPPQMAANLRTGNLDGYCVGEPWNSRAVHEGLGFVVATDLDIYPGHPEKLLGTTRAWAEENPQTHLAVVKALLEACRWCDEPANRAELITLVSAKAYVNADPAYSAFGLSGSYNYGFGRSAETPDFNVFFRDGANAPDRSEALWTLGQMARWNLLALPPNPAEIVAQVYPGDVYAQACQELSLPVADCMTLRPVTLADGTAFDPADFVGQPAAVATPAPDPELAVAVAA